MKGNYSILVMVAFLVVGVAVFVFFGPKLGSIGLYTIEGLIALAIIILLIRYFRGRS